MSSNVTRLSLDDLPWPGSQAEEKLLREQREETRRRFEAARPRPTPLYKVDFRRRYPPRPRRTFSLTAWVETNANETNRELRARIRGESWFQQELRRPSIDPEEEILNDYEVGFDDEGEICKRELPPGRPTPEEIDASRPTRTDHKITRKSPTKAKVTFTHTYR